MYPNDGLCNLDFQGSENNNGVLMGLCDSHFMQNFKFCAVLNMLSTLFLQNIADAVA